MRYLEKNLLRMRKLFVLLSRFPRGRNNRRQILFNASESLSRCHLAGSENNSTKNVVRTSKCPIVEQNRIAVAG